MLIAQISDTHIAEDGTRPSGVVETHGFLARAVDQLLRLDPAPDVVIVTGDLVDRGKPAEYRRLAGLLARLPMPVHLIPGNHDERGALRAGFPAHAYLPESGSLHYAVERWPLRLVGLDTTIPGEAGGIMDAARCAWLADTLAAAPNRPTMLFMHHPPFRTHIAHLDACGLAGADAFAAVLARFDQVERVTCGHVHRAITVRFGGTVATTCPSTAHQAVLELRPDGPAMFDLAPPGFMLHHWDPAAGLRSHVVQVGDHPGPYHFSAAKNKEAGLI